MSIHFGTSMTQEDLTVDLSPFTRLEGLCATQLRHTDWLSLHRIIEQDIAWRNNISPCRRQFNGPYRWCSHLAHDFETAPATASLPLLSLPMSVYDHAVTSRFDFSLLLVFYNNHGFWAMNMEQTDRQTDRQTDHSLMPFYHKRVIIIISEKRCCCFFLNISELYKIVLSSCWEFTLLLWTLLVFFH